VSGKMKLKAHFRALFRDRDGVFVEALLKCIDAGDNRGLAQNLQ